MMRISFTALSGETVLFSYPNETLEEAERSLAFTERVVLPALRFQRDVLAEDRGVIPPCIVIPVLSDDDDGLPVRVAGTKGEE